jgi:DNA replication and repair protein RecF
MYLKNLQLHFFRNYGSVSFEFSEQVNCVLGDNGSGKTNLLDAVYYLALTKSATQSKDELNIQHDQRLMALHGHFQMREKEELISLSMIRGQAKSLLHDKKPYDKKSDHIGKYPVVLIAPDNTDMIRDASDTRRKLFDGIIAQADSSYLDNFQKYNRLVDQRNKLLKQFIEQNYFDQSMLDTYDEQLVPIAIALSQKRRTFIADFSPLVQKHYKEISNGKEETTLQYESEVDQGFGKKLKQNQWKDRQAQRTTIGIHKDDYAFDFDGVSFKKYGSQGQKKSLVMAVKMAQFDLLHQIKEVKPILLLDDIFDKLDDSRIAMLVQKIGNGDFGQVFISDARPERTQGFMAGLALDVRYFFTS